MSQKWPILVKKQFFLTKNGNLYVFVVNYAPDDKKFLKKLQILQFFQKNVRMDIHRAACVKIIRRSRSRGWSD